MIFKAISYEPEFFRRKNFRLTTSYKVFSQKTADSYDTYERLVVAEHAQDKNDIYGAKSIRGRAA